jgi:hypothetical protein
MIEVDAPQLIQKERGYACGVPIIERLGKRRRAWRRSGLDRKVPLSKHDVAEIDAEVRGIERDRNGLVVVADLHLLR